MTFLLLQVTRNSFGSERGQTAMIARYSSTNDVADPPRLALSPVACAGAVTGAAWRGQDVRLRSVGAEMAQQLMQIQTASQVSLRAGVSCADIFLAVPSAPSASR